GMTSEEARAAAHRQFGNTARLAEESRDLFAFRFAEDLCRDAAVALRSIFKSPGFALVVIAALTIGVGANVTVFGFVNALLRRPWDVADPTRLVRVYSEGTDPRAFIDYTNYVRYRDQNRSLSSLAMSQWGGLSQVQTRQLQAQMVHVMPVTGNY